MPGAAQTTVPETFRRQPCEPGVYVKPDSPLISVLASIEELASWKEWYRCPTTLGMDNGHVHTILASQLRKTSNVCYERSLLPTEDGGRVALDMLRSVLPEGAGTDKCEFIEADGNEVSQSDKDFLLLVAGLGGGSDDSYVRSMGAAALRSGRWDVGVVNMRSCGGAPLTSPRFFSAFRGATDDVRLAIAHVRKQLRPGAKVAVVGWSNGATILNNALAEQATTHKHGRQAYDADAGVTLACPLNMPLASSNLQRFFHKNVYDRAIAKSLSTKIAQWKDLFLDEQGNCKPVPAWEGLGDGKTFYADPKVLSGELRTIRGIDEAITRRCFGFDTVDDYYKHASSDQRLHAVDVPLMMINAADDPIAYLGPAADLRLPAAIQSNDNLALVLTKEGGHLGWCDADKPWGSSTWIEKVTLDFLDKSLRK